MITYKLVLKGLYFSIIVPDFQLLIASVIITNISGAGTPGFSFACIHDA